MKSATSSSQTLVSLWKVFLGVPLRLLGYVGAGYTRSEWECELRPGPTNPRGACQSRTGAEQHAYAQGISWRYRRIT